MQRVEGYMSRAEQLREQLERQNAPRAVAAAADVDKCVWCTRMLVYASGASSDHLWCFETGASAATKRRRTQRPQSCGAHSPVRCLLHLLFE
jgi:hypothetical protein